jgi:malate dehydrogenase (oxaloacetate-decarboxylating)
MSHYENSLTLHQQTRGKWAIASRVSLETQGDLSVAYTPGVARVSEVVAENKARAYDLTMKGNTVAIVSDGTAVLGLGNIGPEGALPVMEGKAVLFKRFADVDAVPLVLDTSDPERIIETVRAIAPTFGGINLEDIAAPACFRIERALQDIGIPVFHDDQDGTAIVLRAALTNAAQVVGKPVESLKVVINGAGAAGTAIARLLRCVGHADGVCTSVASILVCDTKGIVSPSRSDMNDEKRTLLAYTNVEDKSGSLRDALRGADVFVGVSKGNLLTAEDIKLMAPQAIVFAMANPIPEITPDEAFKGGAAVVGTGRSDYPNQVNNVLVFPGVFRGALDARATRITHGMKIAAANALAAFVETPTAGRVLPSPFEPGISEAVAEAVRQAAVADGVSRT